jgi:hypothetical protein
MASHHYVFKGRHLGKQPDVLEGTGNASNRHFVDRRGLIRFAGQFKGTTVRRIEACDHIKKGAPLLTLHTDEPARFERALEILDGAIAIVENGKVERLPLVLERITG